jgi:HSP20 family protein
MFDDFFNGSLTRFPGFDRLSTAGPSIDVEEILITAEVPGLDSKDFTVTLSGDVLTIAGEKKDARDEKRAACSTWSAASARSRVPFGCPSMPGDEKVDHYEKGVLTVRISKSADLAKTSKQIEVRPG